MTTLKPGAAAKLQPLISGRSSRAARRWLTARNQEEPRGRVVVPVVILPGLSAMPGLAQAPTDEAMFDLLRRWSPALPRQARSSLDAARDWVATLPYPCGWYADLEEARDRLRQRRHVPPGRRPMALLQGRRCQRNGRPIAARVGDRRRLTGSSPQRSSGPSLLAGLPPPAIPVRAARQGVARADAPVLRLFAASAGDDGGGACRGQSSRTSTKAAGSLASTAASMTSRSEPSLTLGRSSGAT